MENARVILKKLNESQVDEKIKYDYEYKYHVYVDRNDGKGFELAAWYDDPKKAEKEANFMKGKGYKAEVRKNESLGESTINESNDQIINYSEIRRELRSIEQPLMSTGIDIIELPQYGKQYPGAGINWPAKGTVSVEDAKKFTYDLKKAIDACEKFNKKYVGSRVNYGED